MKSRCSADDCERQIYAKSLCRPHYGRLRRSGSVEFAQPPDCSVDGCARKHSARGWCLWHYDRWRRFGDPLYVAPEKPKDCSVEECGRPRFSRGWCTLHYNRWKRTGEVGPAGTIYRYGALCAVEGCGRPHWGKGWCEMHYRRWKVYGDPLVDRGRGWNLQPGVSPENRPAPRAPSAPRTWRAMHRHLDRNRGKAANHACVRCGEGARDWAYDNADPDVRFDEAVSMAYSVDVNHYLPMCKPCHKKFDELHRRSLLAFLVARVIQLESMLPTVRRVG